MDRLTKLERKIEVIAKWFGRDDYHASKVRADLAAIDAKPAEEPKPAPNGLRRAARDRMPLGGRDAQALEGALAMTERERDEARAEIARLKSEAKDDEEALDHYRARTYRDGETDQLQRDLDAARAALAMKERERDAARRERDAARAEIARLEARDREGRWIAVRSAWGQPNIVGADATEWRNRRSAYLSSDPPAPDPLLVEAREVLADREESCSCALCHDWHARRKALLAKLDARIGGRP